MKIIHIGAPFLLISDVKMYRAEMETEEERRIWLEKCPWGALNYLAFMNNFGSGAHTDYCAIGYRERGALKVLARKRRGVRKHG